MRAQKTIVYCCDSNGTAAAWMEHSIKTLSRYNRDCRILIASQSCEHIKTPDGIPFEWLDARPMIEALALDKIMNLRYHRGSCDPMILYRLALPVVNELRDLDRFLYIDCDTEILGSLDELFEIECDSEVIGCLDGWGKFRERKCRNMMLNPFIKKMMCKNSIRRFRPENNQYINSGVIAFNPKTIHANRRNYCDDVRRLIDLMVKFRLFWDQDLINLYFDIHIADGKYNTFSHYDKPTDRNAVVAHFVGKEKLSREYPPKVFFDTIEQKENDHGIDSDTSDSD